MRDDRAAISLTRQLAMTLHFAPVLVKLVMVVVVIGNPGRWVGVLFLRSLLSFDG